MAKLFGLDIPDGLETAFSKVIALKPNLNVLGASLTLPKQNHARRKRTANRSLILLWAPLFDSLTSSQRLAWEAYWGSWPGSGFSAFIQVNAPLYKAGLSLLLDPPNANLVLNGNFNGNANGWTLFNYIYRSNGLSVPDVTDSAAAYGTPFHLIDGANYLVQFKLSGAGNRQEVSIDNGLGDVAWDEANFMVTRLTQFAFTFTNTIGTRDDCQLGFFTDEPGASRVEKASVVLLS